MKELIQDIMNNPFWSSTIVFFSQIFFIYLRTLNIIYTAEMKTIKAIITGFGVGILTLISFSIGIKSVMSGEITPVVLFLVGGAIGTYWGIKQNEKNIKK